MVSVVVCSDGKTRRTLTYQERAHVRRILSQIALAELAAQQRARDTWQCENCGVEFVPKPHNVGKQRYCTEKCGSAFLQRKKMEARQAA
jgi:transposase-like protein